MIVIPLRISACWERVLNANGWVRASRGEPARLVRVRGRLLEVVVGRIGGPAHEVLRRKRAAQVEALRQVAVKALKLLQRRAVLYALGDGPQAEAPGQVERRPDDDEIGGVGGHLRHEG